MSTTEDKIAQARLEIRALLTRIQAAWAAGDAASFAEAYTDDAIFVAFDGTKLNGRESIARFHERPFATHLRGTKLEFDVTDLQRLTEDCFLVATKGSPRGTGHERGVYSIGTQTYTVTRVDARWLVAQFQNTPHRPLRDQKSALLWSIADQLWEAFGTGAELRHGGS